MVPTRIGKICSNRTDSVYRYFKHHKIELENIIYQLAAQENKIIYTLEGKLLSVNSSEMLSKLMHLYNDLFRQQNKHFLAADSRHTRKYQHDFCAAFRAACKKYPLVSSFFLDTK